MSSQDNAPSSVIVRTAVRRPRAERYLLITLLCFAASVTVTRLFLNITGFPQIGKGDIHIGHVLWGGVVLFSGALLPLMLANRWVFDVSAALSGVGVGLFIDEVGKFITQSSDYFTPAAAPIIYAFFLITLMLLTYIRNPLEENSRMRLHRDLELMEEMLDGDLSTAEERMINQDLLVVKSDRTQPELAAFAAHLYRFFKNGKASISSERPDWIEHVELRWERFEKQWFNRARARRWLIAGLFLWGLYAIVYSAASWYTSSRGIILSVIARELINNRLPINDGMNAMVLLRVGGESLVGFALVISGLLFAFKQERFAFRLANIALLFSLTVVYLIVFYYDQFSSIFYVIIQFLLLLNLNRYRMRFITTVSV